MEEEGKVIFIDENNKIEIITGNYIWRIRKLIRDKNSNTDVLKWTTDGYYPDLVSICQSYIKDAPRNSEAQIKSLQDIVDAIEKADKTIRDVFGK